MSTSIIFERIPRFDIESHQLHQAQWASMSIPGAGGVGNRRRLSRSTVSPGGSGAAWIWRSSGAPSSHADERHCDLYQLRITPHSRAG